MKKYTLEKFIKKYEDKRHVSCGINYADGSHDTMMNASLSQIISYINHSGKTVDFIISR